VRPLAGVGAIIWDPIDILTSPGKIVPIPRPSVNSIVKSLWSVSVLQSPLVPWNVALGQLEDLLAVIVDVDGNEDVAGGLVCPHLDRLGPGEGRAGRLRSGTLLPLGVLAARNSGRWRLFMLEERDRKDHSLGVAFSARGGARRRQPSLTVPCLVKEAFDIRAETDDVG